MDAIITAFAALAAAFAAPAAYLGKVAAAPLPLAKGPDTLARLTSARSVVGYSFGAALPDCTVEDVLKAYKARKVSILDYGTSVVVMARYGRGRGTPADTRFVVK